MMYLRDVTFPSIFYTCVHILNIDHVYIRERPFSLAYLMSVKQADERVRSLSQSSNTWVFAFLICMWFPLRSSNNEPSVDETDSSQQLSQLWRSGKKSGDISWGKKLSWERFAPLSDHRASLVKSFLTYNEIALA